MKRVMETIKRSFDWINEFKLCLNFTKCIFRATFGKLLVFNSKDIEVDPSKVKAICKLQPPAIVKKSGASWEFLIT